MLDAAFLRAVTNEVRPKITDLKIEKVFQPSRDRVILILRGNLRLLLCASADAPRMQFAGRGEDNPAAPPMFCMLLRKHLVGGRVVSVEQPSLERLIRLEIDAFDELGRAGRRTLVLEAIPRRANLILLDADGRILDALRRVDAEQAPDRPVLPGLFYREPAPQDKIPFTDETEAGFFARLSAADAERPLERFLLQQYFGLSPLLARELAFRACGETDAPLSAVAGGAARGLTAPDGGAARGLTAADGGAARRLWDAFAKLADAVRDNRFTPFLFSRDGQPFDFSCVPVLQYGLSVAATRFPDCSALLDAFYEARERRERARVRGAELTRTVTTARDRLRRKLALQQKDFADAQKRDKWRVYGDLITANLYRMERGQASLTCENFHDPGNAETVVPLDPLLTPQQNAAKYYKRYARARNAEAALTEQMELARRDLDYLESALEELSKAETEQDFAEIRLELRESGFLRDKSQKGASKRGKARKEPKAAGRPREYRTASGMRVLAGRNNRQNDALTKAADRNDIWLHTQKIHGSHVILCTEGRTPSDTDITEAAAVAAWWSQARESANVPVDYTPVRYVKKPNGARPGMVIYTTYRTAYVKPNEPQ